MGLRSYLKPGLEALRRYWRAFLLIQSAALAVVLAYFFLPGVAGILDTLGALKTRGGVAASALVSALAGGLLPELAKLLTGIKESRHRWLKDTTFNLVFFALSGIAVHYFYAYQAVLFGEGKDPATLAKKVALDQLGFTVFWATPFGLTAFALHRHRYNLIRAWPDIHPWRIAVKAPSLILTTWAFWVPMVTMVYALPTPLQFPLFACALAAWSLLLVFIATPPSAESVS